MACCGRRISVRLAYFIPSLLLGIDESRTLESVRLESDKVVDGQECCCLTGVTSNGVSKQLLVSKAPICVLEIVSDSVSVAAMSRPHDEQEHPMEH